MSKGIASLCLGFALCASTASARQTDPDFKTAIELCTNYPKGSADRRQLDKTLNDTGWILTQYTTRKEVVRQIHTIAAAFKYYSASAGKLNVSVDYLGEQDPVEMGVLGLEKVGARFLMIVPLGGHPVCLLAGSDQIMTAINNVNLTQQNHFLTQLQQHELLAETTRTLYEGIVDDTYIAHVAVVDKNALLSKIQSFKDSKYNFDGFLEFHSAIYDTNIIIGPTYLTNKVTP